MPPDEKDPAAEIDAPNADAPRELSRRDLVRSVGVMAGVAVSAPIVRLLGQKPAAATATPAAPSVPTVPLDATKVPGLPSGPLGARSPFESPALSPLGVVTGTTNTPLQALRGTMTPSDLHFQRHHNGIAVIDPAKHTLVIHGLVDRPLSFTLDDLKRFPSVTRACFIECAGNGRSAYRTPKPEMTPQDVDGMTSNSEWTGVPVATLLREAGVQRGGSWVLAEGGDAALLSRSIPMAKMQDDAMVAFAQNGEAVRLANGYPMRLLLPGYEGNMCIKYLRRLKVIDQPNMSRDETSKYTDPLPDGTSRQFSFVMDAKSIITSPAYPERLQSKGWWPITGLAWSGRGRITGVDVSSDGGQSWREAELVGPVASCAHTRFELMWEWTGRSATLMSRATDETGYVQPTLAEYKRVRGVGTDYHFNAIRSWNVSADGTVGFGG
jgi:sulfane dehydrogenase subunit SoxC